VTTGSHSVQERLVFICHCEQGLGQPHIHWDLWRNEPETMKHPEPWPELLPPKEPKKP
jgi:hypothetical protein